MVWFAPIPVSPVITSWPPSQGNARDLGPESWTRFRGFAATERLWPRRRVPGFRDLGYAMRNCREKHRTYHTSPLTTEPASRPFAADLPPSEGGFSPLLQRGFGIQYPAPGIQHLLRLKPAGNHLAAGCFFNSLLRHRQLLP